MLSNVAILPKLIKNHFAGRTFNTPGLDDVLSDLLYCLCEVSDCINRLRVFCCVITILIADENAMEVIRLSLSKTMEKVLNDLDWEVRLNAVDMMSKLYQVTSFDYKPQLGRLMKSWLPPLLESMDDAVRERASDFASLIDSSCDQSVKVPKNDAVLIEEMKSLLVELLHKLQTHYTHIDTGGVDVDCY